MAVRQVPGARWASRARVMITVAVDNMVFTLRRPTMCEKHAIVYRDRSRVVAIPRRIEGFLSSRVTVILSWQALA